MTRPRSPTQSEIEHILHANDIEFTNFIDYHFSVYPTSEDEAEIKAAYNITTAGNDNTTSTPAPPSGASATSTDTWVDRTIYMYFHPVGQIWLPYPPEGVPLAEDLYAVEKYREGRDGVQSSKNLFDRLVDLGIRALVSAKRRRFETRGESAGEPKRVGRKLTKRRPEGGDGRTM